MRFLDGHIQTAKLIHSIMYNDVYGLAHYSMFYAESRIFTSFALR